MINMPLEFDAGSLKVKAAHKFKIPVLNTSTDKLDIVFKTSCGCSSPKPVKIFLEGKQATEIEVEIAKTTKMDSGYVRLYATVTHVNGVGMVNPPEDIKKQLTANTKINFKVV